MASACAQRLQPLPGHLAHDADRQAGAGEGLAPDDLLRQPQRLADRPHLVLEQVRSGSISSNFISPGSPPTLWCVLIVRAVRCSVAAGDSITSG